MEEDTYKSKYTGAEIDAGIDKAYSSAPQATTYSKSEIDSMIPDVEYITTSDIDNLFY